MLIRGVTVGEQTEARDTVLQGNVGLRCFEGDTAGHQAGQGFAFDLDATGEPTSESDTAGVPETCRAVDQAFILFLDMNADHELLLLA